VKFDDEDKALILLNSLLVSPTYENLVTTLMCGVVGEKLSNLRKSQVPY
jgi:hypothetical protein